ncbi:hypothetical protein LOTGIDRAFT_174713 [Lottia gigantea]|uniref:SAM-dependent MTase RsmB/NOP-type domain-containing protein n=1 Tax=Lottia gigantea TaxID=225164 RepID=V4ASK5_LOTGI|nr:hypothetical protein LOTGIDRAFT_174713 [Lottia gigantea]ESO96721.1 hypothetical protein LOTGIDRAFT_174713 [Lottia gigantea]
MPLENNDLRVDNLIKWLGIPPSYTTLRLNLRVDTADNILSQVQQTLNIQCRKKNIEEFKMWLHPAVKDCLVIENRRPNNDVIPAEKEVIVDLLCGTAVLRGADIFSQGIMGAPSNMLKGDKVAVYCDMEGKCRRGAVAKYEHTKVFLGNGIAQIGRDDYFCSQDKVSGIGILMTETIIEAPCLDILPELVFAQNLPSIVCSHVLDPQPTDLILDMCAAPGGKTVHIASLMQGKGRVIALDKAKGKIEKIKKNVNLWGLDDTVSCFDFDARNAMTDKELVKKGVTDEPPFPPEAFDRILLDGPCSALGQRPTLKNNMIPGVLKSFPKYQKQLLKTAIELLKPNGILVYSTCTVTVEENEHQVEWVLENFPNMILSPQSVHLGCHGTGSNLSEEELKMVQRFDISGLDENNLNCDNDTIGFFIAKFIKT